MLNQKIYEPIKSKYQLPDFNELDKYFSISDIENESNVLKEIRYKMHEKFEQIAKVLSDFFNPEQSFAAMYELKILDETKKKKYFILFKKIMTLLRESEKLSLKNIEKEDANFIKNAFKEYLSLMPDIEALFSDIINLWKSKDSDMDSEEYFG